jgi:hypothetical protein
MHAHVDTHTDGRAEARRREGAMRPVLEETICKQNQRERERDEPAAETKWIAL